jgi:23S rRNA maturation-related 3'-5' exoribonuclease YhaM
MLNHITKDKIKKEGLHTIKAIVGMKDAAQIRLVAVISKSALAAKKAEGEFYLATTLFDKTGTISMPLWNSAKVLSEELTVGTVVFVTGTKGSYKDVPQISMKTIEIVDDIESTAFIPKYKTEVQILVKKIAGVCLQN